MKAVRLWSAGDLRVEDIAPPSRPEAGWVRLRPTAAGICGSDIHNFRTGQWISRSPSVAGHEFAGVVTEVGEGVTGFLAGDTVVADSRFWCGACTACRSGRRNVCEKLGFVGEVCDGGFAEETALPARLLVRHDPSLDRAIAAMAEPLAVALHAVRRLAAPKGEPVLVIGCGPIGGLAALLLSRLHDGPLLVGDRNRERAALVAAQADAHVIDLADGVTLHDMARAPVRYALDATGSVPALEGLLGLLQGGGALALVGIAHRRIDLDPNLLVEKEIALVGCHAFGDELPEAVGRLPGLAASLRAFVGDEIALSDVPDAYGRLVDGTARGLKTIIRVA